MKFIRKLIEDFHRWKREAEEEISIRDAKLRAYEEIRTHILQEMAGATGYPNPDRSLKFVPRLLFDMYEMSTLPGARYTDVKAANEGYDNLLYKSMPVTWEDDK